MIKSWRSAQAAIALFLLFSTPVLAASAGAETRDALRAHIAATAGAVQVNRATDRLAVLRSFYAARDYEPIWLEKRRPNPRAVSAFALFQNAGQEGLSPRDYLNGMPAAGSSFTNPAESARFEILMSDTLLRYLNDLRTGRTAPAELEPDLFVANPAIDQSAALAAVAMTTDLHKVAAAHTPANPVYRNLRESLAAYHRIREKGGWSPVPAGPKLAWNDTTEDPGPDVASRVDALRARLIATLDLLDTNARTGAFDEPLHRAVIVFQKRHGLDPDGVVGPATLAALNVPVDARIAQIALNMERWRWMPDDLGARHVLVNIAAFSLQAMENGSIRKEMRVVVGRQYRRTPIFSDSIKYLEINPFWHVPPKLAVNDILPKIIADPTFLETSGFTVFDGWGADARPVAASGIEWARLGVGKFPYKLRQNPGPMNSLGNVKFMFPNKHDVYLHDSPARELFGRNLRAFSSGCIRVERPIDLAEFVLAGQPDGARASIEDAITGKSTKVVRLETPVPVHLTYFTAWTSEDGTIQFRDDVYERDSALARALSARRN